VARCCGQTENCRKAEHSHKGRSFRQTPNFHSSPTRLLSATRISFPGIGSITSGLFANEQQLTNTNKLPSNGHQDIQDNVSRTFQEVQPFVYLYCFAQSRSAIWLITCYSLLASCSQVNLQIRHGRCVTGPASRALPVPLIIFLYRQFTFSVVQCISTFQTIAQAISPQPLRYLCIAQPSSMQNSHSGPLCIRRPLSLRSRESCYLQRSQD
jgi:hypothetical protein